MDNDRNVSKKQIWKSYVELAGGDEHRKWADDEFPDRDGLLDLDRRDFLKLTGAGMALAGVAGCRHLILPDVKAVPYVRAPEGMVPGKSQMYATALSLGGYATGVLAVSHEGRPTKIEGNPAHPASLGSTDVFAQADILGLYDPERAQSVIERGEVVAWSDFIAALRVALKAERGTGGAGLRVVTETITAPTLAAQLTRLLARYPNAKWIQYEPLQRSSVHAGAQLAFGRVVNPVYQLKYARTVVALDADVFSAMPGSVRYARDFADNRRIRKEKTEMARLYAVESAYTITGASADHRASLKPSEVDAFARALYSRLTGGSDAAPSSIKPAFFDALVKDLQAAGASGVVIPGDQASPAVHALAHGINGALGAIGKTVVYTDPIEVKTGDGVAELKELVGDLNAGRVKALVILGGNPVYNAPADLNLGAALEKVEFSAHLSLYDDETSVLCRWHLPESHPLESWGDARAFDGTVTLVQPLIQPLYATKSVLEMVSELLEQPIPGRELVRAQWKSLSDSQWGHALSEGMVPATALNPVTVAPKSGLLASVPSAPAAATGGFEINFRPDPTLWDGRYANNSWLQELPKPVTTLVWDNAAIVSIKTARDLGIVPQVGESDAVNIAQWIGRKMVELTVGKATLKIPVWILPGQPDGTITLTLGGGRTVGGEVSVGRGFNTYLLRNAESLSSVAGVKAAAVDEAYDLVFTQPHHLMRAEYSETSNRDLVRSASLQEFVAKKGEIHEEEHHELVRAGDPEEAHGEHEGHVEQVETYSPDLHGSWQYADRSVSNKTNNPSVYPEYSNKGYNQWAMSIDLTTCIGCNACTIACQAENNIPTVGKDQVSRGREMHWIRIDHYYESAEDLSEPVSHFMPVPCMHCEKAPCEPVCPVAATIHSHEGLNQMVYNRCIGTRYCSNNCPYKVRRFNFLKWTEGSKLTTGTLDYYNKPQLKMLANPHVSVRGRGVMEKCTYCVQRINEVRIEAKKEGREIQDGEIITACQQVCPTQAIVFGDISNPASKVSQLKTQPHDYGLLADLNTRPRTTYLAKVRNLNPDLEKA